MLREHRLRHSGAVRIALVHYTYLPVVAGVELVMAEHARLFADAGHEVTIVCHRSESAAPSAPRIVAIPEMEGTATGTAETLRAKLRPILAEQDVVILHNVATMHFHIALTEVLWELAHALTAVRFVCWIHDLAACNPDYELPPLDSGPWRLLAQAHPRFTYVAVSELRRRQLAELTGLPASACLIIPNGVEPAWLLDLAPQVSGIEARYSLLERDVILLHPARLLRRKNVELTLRVTAAIKAARRSCACLITALPDVQKFSAYETDLRELHAQLGLDEDAFFLNDAGPIETREMRGLFDLADALFFPSRQEGFGIPVLEAALHRVPIFCSDIDPLNSLLAHGVVTFPLTLPPGEIAALLLQTLAADAAHCARKQTLRTYSWRAIYRNFLAPLLANPDTRHRL